MTPAERAGRQRRLRAWHRRLGLAVAIVIAVVVASGIALNHGHSLGLDRGPVRLDALLDWYGLEAPEDATIFRAGEHIAVLIGDRLYVDGRALPSAIGRLDGVVAAGPLLAVAADGELLLLGPDGALVERIGTAQGAPGEILRLGTAGRQVVLKSPRGLHAGDADFLEWRPLADAKGVAWSRAGSLDARRLSELRRDYRRHMITLERVLLDVHTGRILGRFGPWIVDLSAVVLLVLAITGFWIWATRRN